MSASQKTYELTDQELDLIGAALGKLPFEAVHNLIKKLLDQYNRHASGALNDTPIET